MLTLMTLMAAAFGRDVVREGPPAVPPEAWFVLDRPTWCEVVVVVGPDGVPGDAHAESCPAVLAPAALESALRWRWVRTGATTAEEIEVEVRPPQLSPRPRRDQCLVGFNVDPYGFVVRLTDPRSRCAVVTSRQGVAPAGLENRPTTAWCMVEVLADAEGLRSVQVEACSEGFAESAVATVRQWRFPTDADRSLHILLGYVPNGLREIDW
jgi:hypothetical protein